MLDFNLGMQLTSIKSFYPLRLAFNLFRTISENSLWFCFATKVIHFWEFYPMSYILGNISTLASSNVDYFQSYESSRDCLVYSFLFVSQFYVFSSQICAERCSARSPKDPMHIFGVLGLSCSLIFAILPHKF